MHRAFFIAAALGLAGCVHYRPQPLDPARLAARYRARSLADPGLPVRPAVWDLDSLTAAAVYFSPQVAVARTQYEAARAAVLTARGKPNPTLSLGGGWTNSPESPVVFHFDPAIVLETAGKRGYRILGAERRQEVARLQLAETEWKVRSTVRVALLDNVLAAAELRLTQAESQAREQAVRLVERRLAVGEVSRPEADAVRASRNAAAVAMKSAEGRIAETRAALAAALSLPVSALDGVCWDWPGLASPPETAALPLAAVQQAGLLNRVDVRRSLAEYAVAEATLQLEVAKQYPDITLSPGYGFDEGHHKFSIGPGLPIPVINRNRGPIAEAEAQRRQAAAQFAAVQAQAISEMEQAVTQYEAAIDELHAADGQLRFLERSREPAAVRAVAAGESDRLTLNTVRLETVAAARARLGALRRAQTALSAVEQAAGAPLWPRESHE